MLPKFTTADEIAAHLHELPEGGISMNHDNNNFKDALSEISGDVNMFGVQSLDV